MLPSLLDQTLSEGASTVLNWLSNLTSIAAFIQWATICVAFLRFKSACEAQGIDRSASKYIYNRFQPIPAYWAIFWWYVNLLLSRAFPPLLTPVSVRLNSLINIIFNGYAVFIKGMWNTSDFIIAYINLPIGSSLLPVEVRCGYD